MEAETDAFTIRRIGTSGYEIRDPEGNVIAWTAEEWWALIIAALLNRVEAEGPGSVFRMQQRLLDDKEATPCKAWQPGP